mgnify:CR=1 FL=1
MSNPFFEVIRNPLHTEYKGESIRVPKDALIDPEGNVLGVVGKDYKLITNQEVNEIVQDSISDLEVYSVQDHINGKGNKWTRSLVLNDSNFTTDIDTNDHVKTKVDIYNSYSGKDAAGFSLSAWRLVCENGLKGWRNIASFPFHHIHDGLAEKIRESFEKIFSKFQTNFSIWEKWAEQPLDRNEFLSFIERNKKEDSQNQKGVLSEKQAEGIKDLYPQIKNQYSEKDTIWGAYNVLTAIATHHVKARKGSNIYSQGYNRLSRLIDNFYEDYKPVAIEE